VTVRNKKTDNRYGCRFHHSLANPEVTTLQGLDHRARSVFNCAGGLASLLVLPDINTLPPVDLYGNVYVTFFTGLIES
jgi:hypothetical protein